MSDADVAGRAALVTGGSSGIGYAIAGALREEGYAVSLSARRPDRLDAAARALGGNGDVHAIPANMADEGEIRRVVAEHVARFGRLDVLVNNAGVGIGAGVLATRTKSLDLLLALNLRAVFLTVREAIPKLREAGLEHGRALIVNTASLAGKHGQSGLSAYSATKFGVVGLSQALHKELRDDGIKVTALCPGFVATQMTDAVEDDVPKDRMIQPRDLAEAVRFVLRTSRHCVVPEIKFLRPADTDL
jgi:NAD(P)-dependent dehydrogenase (short-subunit alcohol dehydrogenase family)